MRALLLCVVLALSCQPRGEPRFVKLRMALWGPFLPLGPKEPTTSLTTYAQSWVFEPLARVNAKGRLEPQLASKLERIDDAHYRITIRPDARFSDGSQVSSGDVIDSMTRTGLTAEPDGDALLVRAEIAGFPVEPLLPRILVSRKAGTRLIGTGPFMVSEQDADHVVLTRRVRVPRRVDEVTMVRFANPKDAFVHTLKGDADVFVITEPRRIEFFEGMPALRIIRGPGPSAESVVFNPDMAKADRQRLARTLASDAVRTAAFGDACPPRGRTGAMPSEGSSLRLLALKSSERFAMAVRRAVGSRAASTALEDDTAGYYARFLEGSWDLAVSQLLVWPPSTLALSWHSRSPQNFFHYANPRVDAAFAAGDWDRATQLLEDDAPAALVCTPERVAVVDARITNATLGGYDIFETLPEWEVSE